jgi:hypothetical protein
VTAINLATAKRIHPSIPPSRWLDRLGSDAVTTSFRTSFMGFGLSLALRRVLA